MPVHSKEKCFAHWPIPSVLLRCRVGVAYGRVLQPSTATDRVTLTFACKTNE